MLRRRFLKWLGLVPLAWATLDPKTLKKPATELEHLNLQAEAALRPNLDYRIIVCDDKGKHM